MSTRKSINKIHSRIRSSKWNACRYATFVQCAFEIDKIVLFQLSNITSARFRWISTTPNSENAFEEKNIEEKISLRLSAVKHNELRTIVIEKLHQKPIRKCKLFKLKCNQNRFTMGEMRWWTKNRLPSIVNTTIYYNFHAAPMIATAVHNRKKKKTKNKKRSHNAFVCMVDVVGVAPYRKQIIIKFNRMLNTIRSAQLHASRAHCIIIIIYWYECEMYRVACSRCRMVCWLRARVSRNCECIAWGRHRFSTVVGTLSELQCGTCFSIRFVCVFCSLSLWLDCCFGSLTLENCDCCCCACRRSTRTRVLPNSVAPHCFFVLVAYFYFLHFFLLFSIVVAFSALNIRCCGYCAQSALTAQYLFLSMYLNIIAKTMTPTRFLGLKGMNAKRPLWQK